MASIRLENVSVRFAVLTAKERSFKQKIISAGVGGRIERDEANRLVVEALDDISIEIQHGEKVGLVGHNGSGKSTLLRVIAGIYEPEQGRVEVTGKIAPLLSINIGLDPDLSGYDNIILRGLYLGLSTREIESRIDQIAEFTELGPYLDMPLRTYSAGMQARLAFGISTSIDPEVLLLDEGVAAGDAKFMHKAKARLDAFVERAGIFLLASHSEQMIRRFCSKALLLEHGKLVCAGELDEVFASYKEHRG